MSATPAFIPSSCILATVLCRCLQLSACTVTQSAPAFLKSSRYLSGSSIMRCTSNIMFVSFLRHFMTGAPNDMFGTNAPSITSRCSAGTFALSSSAMPSAICAKSTDNNEGERIIITISSFLLSRYISLHNLRILYSLSLRPQPPALPDNPAH